MVWHSSLKIAWENQTPAVFFRENYVIFWSYFVFSSILVRKSRILWASSMTLCVRSRRALKACAQGVRSRRALRACAQGVRSGRALRACAQFRSNIIHLIYFRSTFSRMISSLESNPRSFLKLSKHSSEHGNFCRPSLKGKYLHLFMHLENCLVCLIFLSNKSQGFGLQ